MTQRAAMQELKDARQAFDVVMSERNAKEAG